MRIVFLILFFATLVSGCNILPSGEENLCKEDKIFCDISSLSGKSLKDLGDERLEKVTLLNYKEFHPPFHFFSEEIGARGARGVRILIHLSEKKNSYSEYMITDIVKNIKETSNIEICIPEYKDNYNYIEKACRNLDR